MELSTTLQTLPKGKTIGSHITGVTGVSTIVIIIKSFQRSLREGKLHTSNWNEWFKACYLKEYVQSINGEHKKG